MRPIRLEVKLLVGMGKAVEIMRGAEIRLEVAPQIGLEPFDVAVAALLQRRVDQFARRHLEAGMLGVEPAAEALQHLVVGAAFAGRLDQLGADRNVLVAAAVIEIVMLHEHRRRQHDVGHLRRLGHELLVHRHEQVFARKALAHQRPAPAPPSSGWCSGSASP